MFTDMVGYTSLGQRNESLALALVNEQRKLLRPIFKRHRGREIDTVGDAFLVEFGSALDATRCAYDIQRATKEFNISLPEDRRINLRVGLHVGDVVQSKSGDISGDAVNVASRIEPLANPGGVCLTRQVYDHVQNKFELPLESLGLKPLKNVRERVEVFKMVLPWERPEAISSSQNSVTAEVAGLDRLRIAVLPFVSMSPDSNDEYFADGITEEMIARLSRMSGLNVIARTSVMNYKKKEKNASQIGRELGAGTLLEGSIRKAGNRIRVTMQLINSNTDGHLWADSYDRELEDIFEVQAEVAERVARELEIKLLPHEKEDIEKRPTENIEAYELYLRGRELWYEWSKTSWNRAVAYFKRAIQLDPSFALAHGALADCYSLLAIAGHMVPREAISLARSSANEALKLDEHLAEAHLALAASHYISYEWKEVEAHVVRAIELKPSNALAHAWHGISVGWIGGRLDEALEEFRLAVELDPLSRLMHHYLTETLYYARRYDEAVKECKKILDFDPSRSATHVVLGLIYFHKSMFSDALKELEEVPISLASDDANLLSAVACAYSFLDKKADALRMVDRLERMSTERYVAPDLIARVYLALGDKEKSFDLFSRAIEEQSSTLVQDLMYDPIFDNVRSDPRFRSLLVRVGLEAPRNSHL
jgi:adenylate cyclase